MLFDKNIHYHTLPIYVSCFSPDGSLLALGGEDGKVFLHDMKHQTAFSLLRKRRDYISNIEFSADSRYIAISSFDNVTEIFDLQKNESIALFNTLSTIECSVFTPNSILYAAGRNGEVYSWNIQEQSLDKLSFKLSEWPTQMILMGNDYVLISTRSNNIYLYNHKSSQFIHEIPVEKSGITQMSVENSFLMICFVGGEIQLIDIKAFEQKFSIHLHLNEYAEAFSYIEKNIFLVTLPIMEFFDNGWAQQLVQARSNLMKNKIDEANKSVKPFMFHPPYKKEYEALFLEARQYADFYSYVHAGNIIAAFKLSENYPSLLKTHEYTIIEIEWLKLYKSAKQLYSLNTIKYIEEANNRLQPYLQIPSKKNLIISLKQNHFIFSDSDKLVRTRDFKSYFLLAEQYPFLKLEEVFSRVLKIGERTFERMHILEEEESFYEALKVGEYLLHFIPMRPEVEHSMKVIESKLLLKEAIQRTDIQKVYQIIDEYPKFDVLPYFIEFHNAFLDIITKAQPYIMSGKIEELIKLLSNYLSISYTQTRVASLFRQAYIEEILNAKKSETNQIDWVATLHLFCMYFGLHPDLTIYIDELGLSGEFDTIDATSYVDNGYQNKVYIHTILMKKVL